MFSNRLAFAALAGACVLAAAGGGYLASRQTAPIAAATVAPPVAETVVPPAAVRETEAVITDAKPPSPDDAKRAPAASRRESPPAKPAASKTRDAVTASKASPALERSWPSSSSGPQTPPPPPSPSPSQGTVEPAPPASGASVDAHPPAPEPAPAPEPPQPRFEELVVAADSVVGLQIESSLSSERARVEDRVEARVVRDVRVGPEVAIPSGSKALGSVTVVERGGKFKERARLGIRFHTLVLGDGTRVPITTDTIYRYGDAPSDGTAKKIGGGAVAGAILGAIIGGAKGAAVGATAGAGGGTAMVMAGDRNAAEFAAGSEMTARFLSSVTVTVDR